MSVRFQRPMGAVLAGLLLFGGVSLVSVIAGSVPASAVQTNVLRTGSVSGPAVSVGDVLTETISLSSVDGVIRCPQGTAQETVTSNPTAPGTAQLSLVAFSPTDCTYAGFPLSLVAQNLPTTLSVSDGTGNPVLTGPIQVSEAFCTGYSPGLSGSWSNTANAMTFTDQFFSVISGGCAGVAFNVTLGSIVDSTVNGSPEVFVADVSGTVTAMNQSYTAAEGTPITEPSASLELGSSDTDPNPSAQCCDAALVTAPANGTVVVNPDGGFTYTPDAGFSGHDSFTFTLTDTDGNVSAPATVTIPVLANCNVATWAVTGTFPVAPQDAKGFYIGQDGGTFTVFSAHPGSKDIKFTGTVTIAPNVNGIRFSNVIPIKDNDTPPNVDTVSTVGERTLQFLFHTEKSLDGMSFHPSCNSSITFKLQINGVTATTQQIFLGSAKSHPADQPLHAASMS